MFVFSVVVFVLSLSYHMLYSCVVFSFLPFVLFIGGGLLVIWSLLPNSLNLYYPGLGCGPSVNPWESPENACLSQRCIGQKGKGEKGTWLEGHKA